MKPKELLHDYCTFSPERVYILMAIARKKENPNITHSTEVVFREVIRDEQGIDRKFEQVYHKAKNYKDGKFRFRFYITQNARNVVKGYWNYRERMNGWAKDLYNGDDAAIEKMKKVDKNWISELQRSSSKDETRFIFDLDIRSEAVLNRLCMELDKYTQISLIRDTPNGYHIVTEPFNFNQLETDIEYEIKKDDFLFVTEVNNETA